MVALLLFGTKSRPLCRNYNFELLMQKRDRAYILRVNSEKSAVVIMKCNAVLPGKVYRYYTTANMLVHLNITNKTDLENAS